MESVISTCLASGDHSSSTKKKRRTTSVAEAKHDSLFSGALHRSKQRTRLLLLLLEQLHLLLLQLHLLTQLTAMVSSRAAAAAAILVRLHRVRGEVRVRNGGEVRVKMPHAR